MLGTLGSNDSGLPFTVDSAATFFAFFLLSFAVSALPFVGVAGTACLSAIPLEPSAGLEGFEEERRLWWVWYERAWEDMARGQAFAMHVIGDDDIVKAARRIEEENIALVKYEEL